jgi:hypothetical protein
MQNEEGMSAGSSVRATQHLMPLLAVGSRKVLDPTYGHLPLRSFASELGIASFFQLQRKFFAASLLDAAMR